MTHPGKPTAVCTGRVHLARAAFLVPVESSKRPLSHTPGLHKPQQTDTSALESHGWGEGKTYKRTFFPIWKSNYCFLNSIFQDKDTSP